MADIYATLSRRTWAQSRTMIGTTRGRAPSQARSVVLLYCFQVLELDGNFFRHPPRWSRVATPAPPADDAA